MGKTSKKDKKHKKHKHKERKEKKKAKKVKKDKKERVKSAAEQITPLAAAHDSDEDFSIPVDLMTQNKSHAPETPQEYEERQARIRKELDPVTGRARLIKGDGEVLEEIVSKDRHKAINKEATKGDGEYFQKQTIGNRKI